MMYFLFILSIVLIVVGHIFKAKRWSLFINVYEDSSLKVTLRSLSIGHLINALVPYRVGDIVRIILSGRKMKNGYAFSFATVVADLYVDSLIVGLSFLFLYVLGKGGIKLESIITIYIVIFILIIVFTMIAIFFRKQVKQLIAKVASLFNQKIELALLYSSYLFIASLKSILTKIDKIKFTLYTVFMWVCYVLSYILFGSFLVKLSFSISSLDVFITLFTPSAIYTVEQASLIYWVSFLTIPLVVCLLVSFVLKASENQKQMLAIPQVNMRDRLNFLKTYYYEDNIEHFNDYLAINKDVSVIKDYSSGSDASTILIMDNNGLHFRKYGFGKEAKKIVEQIKWIEETSSTISLPQIEKKEIKESYSVYDMPCLNGAVGLFEYIHTVPVSDSWTIIEKVLNDIKNKLYINCDKADPKKIYEYIDNKIIKNINIIKTGNKYVNNLERYDYIVVNGVRYNTLKHYDYLFTKEKLFSIFSNDLISNIHGDITVDNIICKSDDQNKSYYLIDPNTGNILNSIYIDYSKLLQSLHGNYEFLMMVNDVEINDNEIKYLSTNSKEYSSLYEKYKEYLNNTFKQEEIISIYYHEIVNWLRLIPYKYRKNEKTAVVFYTALLAILSDLEKTYEK